MAASGLRPVIGTLNAADQFSDTFKPLECRKFNVTVWADTLDPFIGTFWVVRSFDGGNRWFHVGYNLLGYALRGEFVGPGAASDSDVFEEGESNVLYAVYIKERTSGTLHYRLSQ
jgi:hypothetical protein